MNAEQHTDTGPARVEVSIGPGVAPDAMTYVADRLGDLAYFAPRAVDTVRIRVTRARNDTTPGPVQVAATLATGEHVVRAQGNGANLRTAVDAVHDQLRRQLTDLPHSRRAGHPAH